MNRMVVKSTVSSRRYPAPGVPVGMEEANKGSAGHGRAGASRSRRRSGKNSSFPPRGNGTGNSSSPNKGRPTGH